MEKTYVAKLVALKSLALCLSNTSQIKINSYRFFLGFGGKIILLQE